MPQIGPTMIFLKELEILRKQHKENRKMALGSPSFSHRRQDTANELEVVEIGPDCESQEPVKEKRYVLTKEIAKI